MNFILHILGVVVNLLISLGDGVIFAAGLPIKITQQNVKKVNQRRKLTGEFKLTNKKKIKKKVNYGLIVKSNFQNYYAKVLVGVSGIANIFRSFFLLIITPLSWYFARRKRIIAKKNLAKKKAAKYKQVLRPSIFYKLKYVFVGFILSSLFVFVPLASLIFVSDLPSLSNLSVNYIPKTTKIYDRNGTLLYEIFVNQNRTVVRLSEVPKNLRNATVAIEDKDFYSHPGFDLRGIVRALVVNVQRSGFQGGSTITQQLVKSAFLSADPTVVRKIKEVALAFWAERRYSKDEILELYLNYVPYGGTAWGIESAADIYFGKKVGELTLAESAFLAGLPQSPSIYSPLFNEGNTWKRRQVEVLDAMTRSGYISSAEKNKAASETLTFRNDQGGIKAPHFVMYVRNLLTQKYGISEVERGGLSVTTSLDLSIQEQSEDIVREEVEKNAHLSIGNGAALITNPSNGDILAMVGSRDYFDRERDGNVNLTTSQRQPGSSIKLVTYALALSQGHTEATILDDTPLTITSRDGGPSYAPVNYDGVFHGRIPLRSAFANSYNIPPVRIAQKFGAEAVKKLGEEMGISSWHGLENYGVSITLGAADVRMTEMAEVYGTVANLGNRIDLDPILEIKDAEGTVIYKKDPKPIEVLDAGVSFILSDILADNIARSSAFGPNSTLNIPGARVSVKTGTTDSKRDNWTIGFTPKVLVATWVGNNDNTPMNQALASGVTGAAPIWNRLMTDMLVRTGTPSAAIIPANITKKFCIGQERYFVNGTENSVNCRGNFGTPSPSTTNN